MKAKSFSVKGFKESSARGGGGAGVKQPLHKKFFHEATSIRALMSEPRTQTLRPRKPQPVAAVSLLVPAASAKVLITPWDAAGYKPRAVLPDGVRKQRPVSQWERSDLQSSHSRPTTAAVNCLNVLLLD